jgi:opacity protein-like surface antigen
MRKASLRMGVLVAAGFLAAGSALWGADLDRANWMGVSPRFGLGVSVEFSGLGGFPARTDVSQGDYDDGFNRVDASGNQGGLTWNWGYQRPDQVQGDSILLSSSSSAEGGTSVEAEDEPEYGIELFYGRELGRWGISRWGFEVGLGYTDIGVVDRSTLRGDVVRTTDAYALGGVIPPLAPYAGSFEGPGPLLAAEGARSVVREPSGLAIEGNRRVEGSLTGLRLGPVLDLALGGRFSVQAGGGLALAYVDSRFEVEESATIPGLGSQVGAGSDTRHEFLVGAYGDARLVVRMDDQWSLFAGVQYQGLGEVTHKAAGRRATLDLDRVIYVTAGAGVRF